MFAPVKPGGWAFGELLSSGHMNALDADHANAVDGLNGGSYELTAPLTIGGDNVTISDGLTAPTVHGPTEIDDDFTVDGDLTVNEDLTVSEDLQCFGEVETQQLQVNNDAVVDGSLTVGGVSEFGNNVTLTGSAVLTLPAAATLEAPGSGTFGGTGKILNLRGKVRLQQDGKLVGRNAVIATGGDQSVVAAQVDTVIVPSGVMANGDIITIDDTGAENGMRVRFVSEDGANAVLIRRPGGGAVLGSIVAPTNINAGDTWLEVERVANVWRYAGSARQYIP